MWIMGFCIPMSIRSLRRNKTPTGVALVRHPVLPIKMFCFCNYKRSSFALIHLDLNRTNRFENETLFVIIETIRLNCFLDWNPQKIDRSFPSRVHVEHFW